MTITGGTALGKDEIDQMMKDAEAHAEEDKQKREEAETRNTADSLVFQTEKLLKEQGDKVPADDREKIDVALEEPEGDARRHRRRGGQARARAVARREPGVRAAAVPERAGAADGRWCDGRRFASRRTTRSPTPRSSTTPTTTSRARNPS